MQLLYRIGALALITALAACGGKGGEDDAAPAAAIGPVVPVVSTLTFPLKAAHDLLLASVVESADLYAKGRPETASVDGLCSGELILTRPEINFPQVFEGVHRKFVINTVKTTYRNCPASNANESTIVYYNDQYLPLGSSAPGVYGVWPALAAIPGSVTVGMFGQIGTEQFYSDSTRTTPLGRAVHSYAVEPDTAKTAIVNLITQRFDVDDQLQYTVQLRRRISQDRLFPIVSWEKQDAAPSTMHVIFRRTI